MGRDWMNGMKQPTIDCFEEISAHMRCTPTIQPLSTLRLRYLMLGFSLLILQSISSLVMFCQVYTATLHFLVGLQQVHCISNICPAGLPGWSVCYVTVHCSNFYRNDMPSPKKTCPTLLNQHDCEHVLTITLEETFSHLSFLHSFKQTLNIKYWPFEMLEGWFYYL